MPKSLTAKRRPRSSNVRQPTLFEILPVAPGRRPRNPGAPAAIIAPEKHSSDESDTVDVICINNGTIWGSPPPQPTHQPDERAHEREREPSPSVLFDEDLAFFVASQPPGDSADFAVGGEIPSQLGLSNMVNAADVADAAAVENPDNSAAAAKMPDNAAAATSASLELDLDSCPLPAYLEPASSLGVLSDGDLYAAPGMQSQSQSQSAAHGDWGALSAHASQSINASDNSELPLHLNTQDWNAHFGIV